MQELYNRSKIFDVEGIGSTILGKMHRKMNFIQFVETSLRSGKNNFYLHGNMKIVNIVDGERGHGYDIELKSRGYGHLTSLGMECDSTWKDATLDKYGNFTIDWELTQSKMIRQLEELREVIHGIAHYHKKWSIVHVETDSKLSGLFPTRFDNEPTGFIS